MRLCSSAAVADVMIRASATSATTNDERSRAWVGEVPPDRPAPRSTMPAVTLVRAMRIETRLNSSTAKAQTANTRPRTG